MRVREFFEAIKTRPKAEIYEELGVNRTTIPAKLRRLGYKADRSTGLFEWTGDGPEPLEVDLLAAPRSKETKQPTKAETPEPRKEEIKTTSNHDNKIEERRRISMDIDKQIYKDLKHRAIDEDRDMYRIVEDALQAYLK